MKNEWARDVKDAITRYKEQVLPWIGDGPDFYGAAGMELGNSIYEIEMAYNKMPPNTIKTYTFGLLARFRLLQGYCLKEDIEETEKTDFIKRAITRVDERINTVEFGVDAVLKAEAEQNDEQYQQGL